jgi:hypothetical protein
MTSKEWKSYIRSLAEVSRPDDIELRMLTDFATAEAERDEALRWKESSINFEKALEAAEAGMRELLALREGARERIQKYFMDYWGYTGEPTPAACGHADRILSAIFGGEG